MPGLVTHCVFGARTLARLPDCEAKRAAQRHSRAFFLGCQGPDLFTYNFLRLAFSNHRNLGAYLHNHRVKALFLQMFACLPEQEPERGVCLAYLAGAYCHYVCDSVCHTFVYARTGYDPAHKSARYYGRHAALESDIDAWYMARCGYSYTRLRQEQVFRLSEAESQLISKYLARVLQGTLGDLFPVRSPFRPAFVRRAMVMASFESSLLHDPGAQRRQMVEKFENRVMKFPLLSAKFITDAPSSMPDPMNLAHAAWRDPWKPQRLFTDSFDELFCKGLRLAVWLLPQMDDPVRFLMMTGDTNYHDDRVLAPNFQRLERAVAAGQAEAGRPAPAASCVR